MGTSQILKIKILEEDYNSLSDIQKKRTEIVSVDVVDFDYSKDELWNELKVKSNKAYKELKRREYDLRHNNK